MTDDQVDPRAISHWMLAGALPRLLPGLWRNYTAARKSYDDAKSQPTRTSWVGGSSMREIDAEGSHNRNVQTMAATELNVAGTLLLDGIRGLISGGRLNLYGRFGKLDAPLQAVAPDHLLGFKDVEIESSKLILADGTTAVFSVHFVPLLAAPDFAQRLEGNLTTITDAHVWEDPEIVALLGPAVAGELTDAVARKSKGRALVPFAGTAKAISKALAELDLFDDLSLPSEQVAQLLVVASDRLVRLFAAMAAGELPLEGSAGGVASDAPLPSNWRRPGLRFCVVTGSLYSADGPSPTWAELRIWRSTIGRPVGERDVDDLAPAKPGSPGHREWDKALDDLLARALFRKLGDGRLFDSAADLERQMADFATENNLPVKSENHLRSAKSFLRDYYPKTRWTLLTAEQRKNQKDDIWGDMPPGF